MLEPKVELLDYFKMVFDTLGKSPDVQSGHLEGVKTPEVGRTLDQFSIHKISMLDWNDHKINTYLDLTSYLDAIKIMNLFGPSNIGKWMEYPEILGEGQFGYDPDRIHQHEAKHGGSEAMAEIGSGGTPKIVRGHVSMASGYTDSEFQNNVCQNVKHILLQQEVKFFRTFGNRFNRFDRLAWCKTARSIMICWHASTHLDNSLGGWLLKIAVHAACTLKSAQEGTIKNISAAMILFRLSREITLFLQLMIVLPAWIPLPAGVPIKIVTISAMLLDAGFSFIGAAYCLAFTERNEAEDADIICFGIAATCLQFLNSVAVTLTKSPAWKDLIKRRIKETNFCPSRLHNVTLELHSDLLFNLISRSEHLRTSRKLHSGCVDTCTQAEINQKMDNIAGHLEEGCPCATTHFTPIETIRIVLLDIKDRKLVPIKSGMQYVAISQIWFQGIFGQKSRKCGECTLQFLETACDQLGVRYAWIDTICMPSLDALRPRVVGRLREIYMNAGATLVIDTGLIATKAKTVLDLSLAVWLSDWASRVWTLQEGVLASKLLFCVGNDVLALPQVKAPNLLKDTRYMVSSMVLGVHGQGKLAFGFSFHNVLSIAAGRTTSWRQDYLYGLSALFPPSKLPRPESPDLMAVEVAQLYKTVDLGILQAPFDRCGIEGYRWMPLGAKSTHRYCDISITGVITEKGLRCPVTVLVTLDKSVDRPNPRTHPLILATEYDIDIKYWYSTKPPGMCVGTSVEAEGLIFCLLGRADDGSGYGFVVSQTGKDGEYQYKGGAAILGKVPEKPKSILVT